MEGGVARVKVSQTHRAQSTPMGLVVEHFPKIVQLCPKLQRKKNPQFWHQSSLPQHLERGWEEWEAGAGVNQGGH
jgi:hypothetical protein